MKSIADAVQDIISEDVIIIESLQRGVLNLSAYAKEIHAEVERRTARSVRVETISVTLSRLVPTIKRKPDPSPPIALDRMSVSASVVRLTYYKSAAVLDDLSRINLNYLDDRSDVYEISFGPEKISVVCSEQARTTITQLVHQIPDFEETGLAILTLKISSNLPTEANYLYSLASILATHGIPIFDIKFVQSNFLILLSEKRIDAALQAVQDAVRRSGYAEDSTDC